MSNESDETDRNVEIITARRALAEDRRMLIWLHLLSKEVERERPSDTSIRKMIAQEMAARLGNIERIKKKMKAGGVRNGRFDA